jgi:branched-subunit amino acid transport protein
VSAAWVTVLLAGAGTFAMRASFLAAAHRMDDVPPRARRVLRQIPPAALAALVVPAVVQPDGRLDLLQGRVPAALLAALVAWRTRNAALTIAVGLVVFVVVEQL